MSPHRKPLLVQSGRQPFEVVILVTCFLSGLAGVLTGNFPEPIVRMLHSYAWAYSVSLGLGAIVTLVGVFLKPVVSLLIERVGMVWLGTIFLAYAISVSVQVDGRGITGAILLYGLALATAARAITITRDIRKIEFALKHPVLADERPKLAEPQKGDADNA